MKANLSADGDCGESIDGLYMYLMVHLRAEGGDEVRVGGVKGGAAWDVGEEVAVDKLVLQAPNLPSLFVEDGVEVGMSQRWVSARWRSEKMREEIEVDEVGFVTGGKRLYGGGGDRGRVVERWGQATVAGFARATRPQEGIARKSLKST